MKEIRPWRPMDKRKQLSFLNHFAQRLMAGLQAGESHGAYPVDGCRYKYRLGDAN